MDSYWKSRKESNYYKKVLEIIQRHRNYESIIDIGSANTEILKDLPFKDKVCLDINKLPENEGVRTIKCDFYKWTPDKKYDIVTCLQVLEHLDDPSTFAKKLFELSKGIVIISLPYMWPMGFCKYHVQDPVSEEKILSWTGRTYNEAYIIEDATVKRIVCVYLLK
jgi:hypothetical protein